MNRKSVIMALLVATCLVVGLGVVHSAATMSKGKAVETKAQKGTAKDPAMIAKTQVNAGQQEKMRGNTCHIMIENHTGYKIEVSVASGYVGTVPAWGDMSWYGSPGSATLDGYADLADKTSETWGPQNFECVADGSFTWRLWP